MVHLLPHLEKQIKTKKTPEDICMILEPITDSGKIMFSSNAEFAGQIHPRGFQIVPRIQYRNSFLPVLTGKITEGEGETVIDITAQMHMLTRVYMIIWFGMASFIFLCGIIAVVAGGFEKVVLILVSFGFIAFGQLLMRGGFYGPAGKALKRLKELFC